MEKKKKKKSYRNMLKDILKERGKYSQGRIYLLLSVLAYFITVGVLMAYGMHKSEDFDLTSFQTIIDALQWSLGLFAGYILGGKVTDVVAIIGGKKPVDTKAEPVDSKTEDESDESEGLDGLG